MNILGLAPDVWISSASLVMDGKLVAAAAEERFNRQKMSMAFPQGAMAYCLETGGISLRDVDIIAIPWDPGEHIRSPNKRFVDKMVWRGEYLHSVMGWLQIAGGSPQIESIEQVWQHCGHCNKQRIVYTTHHDAHAASAFFTSPFTEAAILSVDGRGEAKTAAWGKGSGKSIEELMSVELPHSLGIFYSVITEYLGFRPHSDEWKVMALAALGKPGGYGARMDSLVKKLPGGAFELELSHFRHYLFDKPLTLFSDKLVDLLGPARQPGEPLEQRHYDIALALQNTFEDVFAHMLHGLHAMTGSDKLVLAGGAAMNSVYNGKITETTPFNHVYVSPCPDDTGVSLGAALHVAAREDPSFAPVTPMHSFWGPEYSDDEIRKTLDQSKVPYEEVAAPEKLAAGLLAEGHIVGWFQGRMEYGQRALGNRSILADARKAESKELVNAAVKFREAFRPFAPAILHDRAAEYFELQEECGVPFMEKVRPIKADKRDVIPAVAHFDGSGRLQTVSKEHNPLFHDLIKAFDELTGVPVVMNTSFNMNGEPIVASPLDAIRTFYSCGLDDLIIGRFHVRKRL